ncbi:MAG: glycoside hydrolase family 9 protein [Steroidobacteraceae bacterium]
MCARTFIATLLLQMVAACGGSAAEAPLPIPTPAGVNAGIPFVANILVDQFGYRPNDPKVAVIRNPQVGYDGAQKFTPGDLYQVRRASDGEVVFSGALAQWDHGAIEPSSGDKGWWFDFSSVVTPGAYFIYDKTNNARSAIFHIDQHVYQDILKAAMRMYFYQRSGFAKRRPNADSCWVDDPAYIGPNQDTQAHDISDRDNPNKIRNLSGGWFDAGDTNKYVTFAVTPVHQLLTAYQATPSVFTDDYNIPESGNGIPDVIDEVKWETDWLKRMQYPDGSAALKVGEIVDALADPPSSDKNARFYVASCSSATIAVAGMFAHASYVFRSIPVLSGEAADLRRRASAAWGNYQRVGSKQTTCDTGIVRAGRADWNEQDQNAEAVVAAVYLYAITGDPQYADYIGAHYRELRPYHDIGWTRYQSEQGEALLFYASLPNVDANVRKAIFADKANDVRAGNHVYGFIAEDDLYRAYMHDPQYHWGSNNPRANYGNSNVDVLTFKLDLGDSKTYETRALEVLHYFHGVNPLGMVYLSNMYQYGATRSANEIYHTWYAHDTRWSDARSSACGPAPGYVPGGPNVFAVRDGVPSSVSPPAGQPAQKSYRDWNAGWPQSSWAVTEPGIYYQSAYVELLSKFAR